MRVGLAETGGRNMRIVVNFFDLVTFGIFAILAVVCLILFLVALVIDFFSKRQAKKIDNAYKDEEDET